MNNITLPRELLGQMLKDAYRAGFDAGCEGYNGEYGADTSSVVWLNDQSNAVGVILAALSQQVLKASPLRLADFVNHCCITAADAPTTVIEKLQKAIEAAHGRTRQGK